MFTRRSVAPLAALLLTLGLVMLAWRRESK